MIELKNVNVAYGNIKALHDINLIARPGEITAVLGANGAGKSSLLKAIAGAVPSASGAVMINNEDLTRLPAHLRARKGDADEGEDGDDGDEALALAGAEVAAGDGAFEGVEH